MLEVFYLKNEIIQAWFLKFCFVMLECSAWKIKLIYETKVPFGCAKNED